MNPYKTLEKFWDFLKKDTWEAWLVSLILVFLIVKFIFFPALSLLTSAPLPIVVVESCSMYHNTGFGEWWDRNGAWYESRGIKLEEFKEFPFKNGLNKGDIVFVWGRGEANIGDIIIFESNFKHPLIHRMIKKEPIGTKGDNNFGQLDEEKNIEQDKILGKAVARVPGLGWLKLIFFEGIKPAEQRGFCK